ncbi:hypothetical protein LPU83_pLPU83d_0648 (plasmid) [Rhizobium favelukesii]|uniref:Uncharacterized protein n=2 Tax=Rhizobium/Agrobacterium group TaxID=227290 RepID=W6RML8_9HYPH|nr:hypothetical protein LPU83_pLPU83d_0648 [Rhizobium favelukesii]
MIGGYSCAAEQVLDSRRSLADANRLYHPLQTRRNNMTKKLNSLEATRDCVLTARPFKGAFMYMAVAVAVTAWSVTETHKAPIPADEQVATVIH